MSRWTACARIDLEPNLPAWQEYARAHRLHPAVLAYLELRPQHFYKVEQDVDGARFVNSPRLGGPFRYADNLRCFGAAGG